jgi:hypothetical protein
MSSHGSFLPSLTGHQVPTSSDITRSGKTPLMLLAVGPMSRPLNDILGCSPGFPRTHVLDRPVFELESQLFKRNCGVLFRKVRIVPASPQWGANMVSSGTTRHPQDSKVLFGWKEIANLDAGVRTAQRYRTKPWSASSEPPREWGSSRVFGVNPRGGRPSISSSRTGCANLVILDLELESHRTRGWVEIRARNS